MTDFMASALGALKSHFGYDSFREGQAEVVNAILNGRDVMAVMPTGAGKSVCYQLPATRPGTLALVISPLRSLMRDQVQALRARGIPAALIDSGIGQTERQAIYRAAANGGIRLLYVAPERLFTDDFQYFCARRRIDLVVVDEAHCVLQWGHDFRSSYLRIGEFVARLPVRPVVAAFTATATRAQVPQIAASLGLADPVQVRTGFDRPNIRFACMQMRPRKRASFIPDYARTHKGAGVVYCTSRKETEDVAFLLQCDGIKAEAFHAGLADSEKARIQDAFLAGGIRVICATTAFGMGVDKPDIRWIVNDGACDSLEAFYQEAGRAGRDRQPADSLMLWTPGDFRFLRKRIADEAGTAHDDKAERAAAAEAAARRLSAMSDYCEASEHGRCLRGIILDYFGDQPGWDRCGDCSVCAPKAGERDGGAAAGRARRTVRKRTRTPDDGSPAMQFDGKDMDAAVDFVAATRSAIGHGYGPAKTADMLAGRSRRAGDADFAAIPGWGWLADMDRDRIVAMLKQLVDQGRLRVNDHRALEPADAPAD